MRTVPLAVAATVVLAASRLRAQETPAAPPEAVEKAADTAAAKPQETPPDKPAQPRSSRPQAQAPTASCSRTRAATSGCSSAATRSSTAASSPATTGAPGDRHASCSAACGRSCRARSASYFDFSLMPDFGGGVTVLQDAYLELQAVAEAARARRQVQGAGRPRAAAVGDGDDASSSARSRRRSCPIRDVGVQLHGRARWAASSSYAGGDLRRRAGRRQRRRRHQRRQGPGGPAVPLAVEARQRRPLKDLGFGIAGTTGDADGPAARRTAPAARLSVDQRWSTGITADGTRTRCSPQLSFYSGRFGLLARVRASRAPRCEAPTGHAYDLERERLAGDGRRSCSPATRPRTRGVRPTKPFDPAKGQWGALELAARVHGLELDDDERRPRASSIPRGRCARPSAWAVGVNWSPDPEREAGGSTTSARRFKGGRRRRRPRVRERPLHPHAAFLLATENEAMRPHASVVIGPGARGASRRSRGRAGAAERLVRPDARAVPGVQRRVREAVAGEDRRGGRRSSSRTAARGKQARAVIDGLEADVRHARARLRHRRDRRERACSPTDWQKRLPHNSAPYTSTIVFLVRKGNPKGIKDWGDLVKPGVAGDHAEPEDLGRRALELPRGLGATRCGSPAATTRRRSEFVTRALQERARARLGRPRLDRRPSCSAASATCCSPGRTRRYLAVKELGRDKFEIVVPSLSILAEPPVAVVDKVVRQAAARARSRRRTSSILYTPEGQEIAARHYYRPRARGRGAEVRRRASRKVDAVHDRRGLRRLGRRRRRRTSPTAASSTRSTSRS